jgi:hypothetical protein
MRQKKKTFPRVGRTSVNANAKIELLGRHLLDAYLPLALASDERACGSEVAGYGSRYEKGKYIFDCLYVRQKSIHDKLVLCYK